MKTAIVVALTSIILSSCAVHSPSVKRAVVRAAPAVPEQSDHDKANQVLESGSEGRTVSWISSRTGKQYSVTPIYTYRIDDKDCRDYVLSSNGQTKIGTACREDDGRWLPRK